VGHLKRSATSLAITAVLATTLSGTLVLTRPASVDAYTTVFYNGAGRRTPRIGLIGDSSFAGVRWLNAFDNLKRFNFTYDAESCRRTIEASCRGREGYAPENSITVLRRLRGRMGRVLVMVTGYNDPGYRFAEAVDAIMAEAIRQKIQYVMWLTMRTADVSYVSPHYRSTAYTFRDNNRILLQKAQLYAGRLQIADWATYSRDQRSWVTADGVHLTVPGAYAVTDFIVDQAARVLAGRTITPPRTDTDASGWNTLRRGDRGTQVAVVQRALIRRGYSLPGGADGVFGRYTESVVKRFQTRHGLRPTGAVDRRTARRLGVFRPPVPPQTCKISIPLRQRDQIGQVWCLERHLASRGFHIDVDGTFDANTTTAVNFVNFARGWRRDGVADRRVLAAIGAWKPPPGKPPFCNAGVLREGVRHTDVLCLKRTLRAFGYGPLDDTPAYGARVTRAVRHYQRHHGLRGTGVGSARTLTKLRIWRAPCTISNALRPGMAGAEVVCLKRQLGGLGHDLAPITDRYDAATARAVRLVEGRARVAIDGIADEVLLRRLGAWSEPNVATRVAADPPPTTTLPPPTTTTTTTTTPTTSPTTTSSSTLPPTSSAPPSSTELAPPTTAAPSSSSP
jgi:peptidoglycan hydrolase-like protein with peptidoglycan-binding domain